jgi:hypothetical protein
MGPRLATVAMVPERAPFDGLRFREAYAFSSGNALQECWHR